MQGTTDRQQAIQDAVRRGGVEVPITESKTESKRERFLRIATPRVNRVLQAIQLLGNLSSPVYEWNDEDVNAIQKAIVDELGKSLSQFDRKAGKAKPAFGFNGHRESETL